MKSLTRLSIILILLTPGLLPANEERAVFALHSATEDQEHPDVYDNAVVWQQYISQYGDYDIIAADMNNLDEPPFFIANLPSDQINPAIYDNFIVWQNLI